MHKIPTIELKLLLRETRASIRSSGNIHKPDRRHLALYVNGGAGGGHRLERSVHAEVRKRDTSRQELNLRLLRKLHRIESTFPRFPIVKSWFKTVHFTESPLKAVTHNLLKTRKLFRLEVSAITRERNHLILMQYLRLQE